MTTSHFEASQLINSDARDNACGCGRVGCKDCGGGKMGLAGVVIKNLLKAHKNWNAQSPATKESMRMLMDAEENFDCYINRLINAKLAENEREASRPPIELRIFGIPVTADDCLPLGHFKIGSKLFRMTESGPVEAEEQAEMVDCHHCENGQWYAECCNGSRGCSCGGREVQMGTCRVCNGTGRHRKDADTSLNRQSIAGMPYLGSGPTR